MRTPVLAVLGRPNVGKSTLFNRLLRKREAIVHPRAGITRDRKREQFDLDGLPVLLIDTGGIMGEVGDGFSEEILRQVRIAIEECDLLLLVVEADGISGADHELAKLARKSGKPVLVVANKCDRPGVGDAGGDGFNLGFENVIAVSAEHGTNLQELRRTIAEKLAEGGFVPGEQDTPTNEHTLSFALIGRPNTGKSSLLNRLLENERAIVSPIPGTTRDPIREQFDYKGRRCTVVDTAGLRRKSRVREDVEFYSTVRTRRSVEDSEVTVLLLEPETLVTDQDKKITDIAIEHGKGLVFAINKWDLVGKGTGKLLADAVDKIRFQFPELGHVPVLAVSALTGYGVRRLLDTLITVSCNARRSVSTGELNRFVEGQLRSYIPSKNGRQLKIYYAVQTGLSPPRFTFFVNNAKLGGEQYLSYIRNTLRKHYDFSGVPIIVNLRNRKE